MNLIETNQTQTQTMSSLDFLNIYINPARTAAGENEVENRKFVARIEDELDDLGVAEKFSVTTSQGAIREVKGYLLTHDQMMLVGMRESKQVRKSVLSKLKLIEVNNQPSWLSDLSPQAKIALEDLSNQLNAQKIESKRLNGLCNIMANQFQEGVTVVDFCRQLNGVNLTKVNAKLVELGVLNFSYGRLSVSSRVRGDYFNEVPTGGYENSKGKTVATFKIEVLKRGAKWIYSKYLKGELPMKKSWNGGFTHDKELNF